MNRTPGYQVFGVKKCKISLQNAEETVQKCGASNFLNIFTVTYFWLVLKNNKTLYIFSMKRYLHHLIPVELFFVIAQYLNNTCGTL